MFPYMVERKLYHKQSDRLVPVPCGKCPECLKRRTASWGMRLEKECLRWQKLYFLTLTYDNDHLPITPNGFMTLHRPSPIISEDGTVVSRPASHVTLFLKRVRKASAALRYYMCGEYGTHGKRPHYHVIMFCSEATTQDVILRSWEHGDVHFGDVNPASIRYVVQYLDKGTWRPAHSRDDRVPEYSTMSNGLGSNMMTPQMVRHMLADPSRSYLYNSDGYKVATPRYYKKRLYDQALTADLVGMNPSILLHRDDMLDAREAHNKAIAEIMLSIEVEPDSQQRNEDRRAAIINYRSSKRKTRK